MSAPQHPPRVAQVGGTHYEGDLQHWDICEVYDIDGLVWNASKYIDRYDRKGTPRLDLEKALSYLEKMGGRGARRTLPLPVFYQWSDGRRHRPEVRAVLLKILCDGAPACMEFAKTWVREQLETMN